MHGRPGVAQPVQAPLDKRLAFVLYVFLSNKEHFVDNVRKSVGSKSHIPVLTWMKEPDVVEVSGKTKNAADRHPLSTSVYAEPQKMSVPPTYALHQLDSGVSSLSATPIDEVHWEV